jgi:uncharacterized protein YfeS
MEADTLIQSYNTYGGHPTISVMGELVEHASAGVERGVSKLEAVACFASRQQPRKTLGELYVRFHEGLAKLPAARWERKKRRLTIRYQSRLGTAEEILRTRELSNDLLRAAIEELIAVCRGLRPRLVKKQGLDHQAFLAVIKSLPYVLDGLQDVQSFSAEHRTHKQEALRRLPWWEQLGIDWDDYHPKARDLLDDPFFWNVVDDYAPHGNDTGADLLADFMSWRRRHRSSAPGRFLDTLFRRWGMARQIKEWQKKPVREYDGDDVITLEVHDEAVIALAFALIKVDGSCDERSCQQAFAAIERQLSPELNEHYGWTLSDERAKALAKLRDKLRQVKFAKP